MIKEFKEFIARGNVIDMAVGVIIGGAFGKIVTSIVNDVLMPLIGVVSGGIDFTGLSFKINEAEIKYGNYHEMQDELKELRELFRNITPERCNVNRRQIPFSLFSGMHLKKQRKMLQKRY